MAEDQRLRELMREYQTGRFEAFDAIYASIAPALRRYLLSQARDGAKADDLVQETFLQIHRARHTYDASFPLLPWALAIACHPEAQRPRRMYAASRALGPIIIRFRAHSVGLPTRRSRLTVAARLAARLRPETRPSGRVP